MSYTIVPRTESGLPATVTSSNGAPRPLLRGCRWFTIHYTGVTKSYKTADVPSHMRHLQQIWATSKPWEYNYVIGQTDDDKIYEFAGRYQAAHSAGENGQAIGCYFLNGINEPPTPAQIRKAQWLRGELIANGTLRPEPETTPHGAMPGANTSCPGQHILAVMAQIRAPYTPTPEGDDEVTAEQYDTLNAKLDQLLQHARTQAARADYLNNKWAQQTTRQLNTITTLVGEQGPEIVAPPPTE